MSPQAMLCVFILVVCGLIPLIDANAIHCQNLEYTGPIKEVIEMKPTKLAEATDAAAAAAEGFAMDMVSAGIGGIPFVGIMLSSMFDQIVASFGSGGLQIEDVFNSLKLEIYQLKEYMDQNIEEVKIDYIRKAFGTTSRGGMLGYAKHCTDSYKTRANEMAVCLENLRAMLSQQYHFFMPEGETPSAYEQTLPLFRMYGQLYVDTLLDQIAVEKKRGYEDLAERHAEALIATVKEFKEHSEKALKIIVMNHLEPHIMPPKNNPSCAPLSDGVRMCVCTIAIGPSKFNAVDKNGIPTDKTKNFCVGVIYTSRDPCKTTIRAYANDYAREHGTAIVTYWRKQVGQIVSKWTKTAEALQPMVDKHKR